MNYLYNHEEDVALFRKLFGSAWETAAELDNSLGAFVMLDDKKRVVLDENSAHCFGLTASEPHYDRMKELLSFANSRSTDFAVRFLSTDAPIIMYAEFAIARCTMSCSRAPKYRAVTIPQPPLIPLKMEKNKKEIEPVAPTAARAFAPSSWPTIIESAMLYACWKILPISRGSANFARSSSGAPSVMSIVTDLRVLMVFLPAGFPAGGEIINL